MSQVHDGLTSAGRFLLDTHAWIWMLMEPELLGRARALIEEPTTRLILSAVSSWEIAIKVSTGRLSLPDDIERYLPDQMDRLEVDRLGVEHHHAIRVASLPLHHRDPFDRLLVAQCLVEGLPILTADRAFDPYDCEVVRVG